MNYAAISPEALALPIEEWFDKYGLEILRREEAKQKAMVATAGR